MLISSLEYLNAVTSEPKVQSLKQLQLLVNLSIGVPKYLNMGEALFYKASRGKEGCVVMDMLCDLEFLGLSCLLEYLNAVIIKLKFMLKPPSFREPGEESLCDSGLVDL